MIGDGSCEKRQPIRYASIDEQDAKSQQQLHDIVCFGPAVPRRSARAV